MKSYVALLFLCLSLDCLAADFYARPQGLTELSNCSVYSFFQDAEGVMWMSSSLGLCRYNGISLEKIYDPLKMSPIVGSVEDDVFWCQGETEIIRVKPVTGECKRISTGGKVNYSSCSMTVRDSRLLVADGHDIYLGCGDSLELWKSIPKNYGKISFVKETKSGRLFVATGTGLLIELVDNIFLTRAGTGDRVWDLYEDKNHKIWVGMESGGIACFSHDFVNRRDYHPMAPTPAAHRARRFRTFEEDFEGNILVGSLDGMYIISLDGDCRAETSYTPAGHAICSLFQDEAGNIWIGTFYGGSYLCEKNVTPFSSISGIDRSKLQISTGLVEDKRGDMWLVTDCYGMFRFPSGGKPAQMMQGSTSYKMKCAWYDTEEDVVWVGSYLQPFSKYNPRTGRWTHYPYVNSKGQAVSASAFCIEEFEDELWIAGSDKIYLFDRRKEKVISRTLPGFNRRVLAICNANDGSVLIGGAGLCRWQNGTLAELSGLDGATCYHILPDNSGGMWLGTSSGLMFCDHDGRILKKYDKQNIGLADDFVYRVQAISDSRLILGTNSGVSIFNYQSGECLNWSNDSGLPLSSTREGCITKRSDGIVWVAGTDGLVRYDPGDRRQPLSTPATGIDKFLVNNISVPLQTNGRIRLKYSENNISFQASSYDYAGIVPSFSECRLLPFDKDWKEFSIRNPIVYMGLKSGSYTLEVRTMRNKLGARAAPTARLDFTILPPWYWSPVTWVLYVVLLACIVGSLINWGHSRNSVLKAGIMDPTDRGVLKENDANAKYVRIVDAVIEQHISDTGLSVDTICRYLGVSYQTFSARLKDASGCTPGEYIERVRLNKSAELLLDRTLNIGDVAYRVGFTYPQYFATRFKKHFGMTPTQYIAKHSSKPV